MQSQLSKSVYFNSLKEFILKFKSLIAEMDGLDGVQHRSAQHRPFFEGLRVVSDDLKIWSNSRVALI